MRNGPRFTGEPGYGGGVYPSRLVSSCVDIDCRIPGALERKHSCGDQIQHKTRFRLVDELIKPVYSRRYLDTQHQYIVSRQLCKLIHTQTTKRATNMRNATFK